MFTEKQLTMMMPNIGTRARVFYPPLLRYMPKHNITSVQRIATFLATLAHESGEFRYMREIWGPTAAQQRYEFARRLGNEKPGDGKRYLGRCPIQLTGLGNYRRAEAALGIPLVANPHLAEEPDVGTLISCWWWEDHKCNDAADQNGVPGMRAATLIVNGGYNGWDHRLRYFLNNLNVLTRPDFSNVVGGSIE